MIGTGMNKLWIWAHWLTGIYFRVAVTKAWIFVSNISLKFAVL